jgi:hypothetical protein
MENIKSYCTQNNGDCETCSLVSYGRDCKNIPLSVKPRSRFKGRGKTEKPSCPQCGEDMLRSYEAKKGKKNKIPYGWHCSTCRHQEWDK